MKTAILATGEIPINNILEEELRDVFECKGKGLFKADVFNKLEEFKPHYLILGDALAISDEDPERYEFIREIRRRFPGTQLYYIYQETIEDHKLFLRFLVQQQVYNFFAGERLDLNELAHLIENPRTYSAVKVYEDLEEPDTTATAAPDKPKKTSRQGLLNKDDDPTATSDSGSEEVESAEADYTEEAPEEPKVIIEEREVIVPQKQKTIIWYSPSSTGKTTLIQNTAVYLANIDPKLDIALVDFDFLQPKIATRMKLNQKDFKHRMYFQELLQRIDGNRFDGELLREYMYTHPKYPNLKIFDCEFEKPEYQNMLDTHHVERIFDVLKEEFTIILVDLNRDLELIGADTCFRRATSVYHVVDMDFSHNRDFQRSRLIISQIPFMRGKPKRYIINKASTGIRLTPDIIQEFYKPDKDVAHIEDNLEPTPIAVVPHVYEAQINAIYDGRTLVELESKQIEPFRQAIKEIAATLYPVHLYDGKKKNLLQRIKAIFQKMKRFREEFEQEEHEITDLA